MSIELRNGLMCLNGVKVCVTSYSHIKESREASKLRLDLGFAVTRNNPVESRYLLNNVSYVVKPNGKPDLNSVNLFI